MEKELDEKRAKIEEEIKKLPEKAQSAIYWIVDNFYFVTEMCRKSNMTYEEIRKYKEDARKKEDYIMIALLCITETYKKGSNPEATEQ